MEKKILGYLSPLDLFSGKVEKGSLFVKTLRSELFYAHGNDAISTTYRHLPKEIVEQWEVVLENEFKEGDIITDDAGRSFYTYSHEAGGYHYVKESEFSLGTKARKATPEEIKTYKIVKIGDYTAEKALGTSSFGGVDKPGIKFGCQFLSLEDLDVVEKLLNKEIKAEIKIHGVLITKEIINKLKNL